MQKFFSSRRKPPRTILTCSECGAKSGSVIDNPKNWYGWTVAPAAQITCPDCIAKKVPFEIVESISAGKVIRTIVFK